MLPNIKRTMSALPLYSSFRSCDILLNSHPFNLFPLNCGASVSNSNHNHQLREPFCFQFRPFKTITTCLKVSEHFFNIKPFLIDLNRAVYIVKVSQNILGFFGLTSLIVPFPFTDYIKSSKSLLLCHLLIIEEKLHTWGQMQVSQFLI